MLLVTEAVKDCRVEGGASRQTTRARNEDTDFASVSASLSGAEPVSVSRKLGDLNNGTHHVGLEVGPFDLVPNATASLAIAFLVINQGHSGSEEKAQDIADGISKATETALDVAYPAYKDIWTIANALTLGLNALLGADCDGLVVGDKIVKSGAELDQHTHAIFLYTESRHYPGSNSPDGCGSNSSYDGTFAIYRD
jgi:hypothetical protein